ncbi:unnamed protein product [Schistocephalus solidus]|uniref:Integrase catalytic domain-containing protein n=1 Tax=Schistocephalus solidus TaxID=70667 RepID=A0A183SV98_SCHSO|nr:unnamed protein product [Schistocephalus solidus]
MVERFHRRLKTTLRPFRVLSRNTKTCRIPRGDKEDDKTVLIPYPCH